MHVCITGPKTCPPEIGGIEVFAYELGKRLAAQGVKVSLVTHRRGGQQRSEMVKGIEVLRVFGVEGRYSLKLSMIPGLLRATKSLDPDVVHANDATSSFAASMAFGRRSLVTMHGLVFSKEDWPTPFRQGIRLLQTLAMKNAGAVTATDWTTAATLKDHFSNIYVLPGGVDTEIFKKGAMPRPAVFGADRIVAILAGSL